MSVQGPEKMTEKNKPVKKKNNKMSVYVFVDYILPQNPKV